MSEEKLRLNVCKRNGQWCIVRSHSNRTLGTYDSKHYAIRKAVLHAKREGNTDVYIMGENEE